MLTRSARKKAAVINLVKKIEKNQNVTFHTTCKEETAYVKAAIGGHVKTLQIPNYMELPSQVFKTRERKFLFLGRIDKKKGLENLLEAISQCDSFRQNGFHLDIAGDANNRYGQSLKDLCERLGLSDIVHFLGQVEGETKEELLASSHCLVMPSHTENFGIVVSEGLAQGTPAIASKGTPWSILPQEGIGWWTENDPNSLQQCIEKAMALTPAAFEEMSKNAVAIARREFDIHARISEWTKAYSKITKTIRSS